MKEIKTNNENALEWVSIFNINIEWSIFIEWEYKAGVQPQKHHILSLYMVESYKIFPAGVFQTEPGSFITLVCYLYI
jgi:hypothetical protein